MNKTTSKATLVPRFLMTFLIAFIPIIASAQQAQNIRWAARMYPHNPGYIEVFIDARGMTITGGIDSVDFAVAFYDQADHRMRDYSFSLPQGRLIRFKREAYRSIFQHSARAAKQSAGIILQILGPSAGGEEPVIPRLGYANASAWSNDMNNVISLDPLPPSIEDAPAAVPLEAFDTARSYFITSVSSGKVMDARDGLREDWVPIIQTTKQDGPLQQWRFVPLSGVDKGFYQIRSVRSDKCLDVKLGEKGDGVAIIQYFCGDGDGQKWGLFGVGGSAFQLVAKHSGKAVDVNGDVSEDVALVQFTRHRGTNQQWTMISDAPTAKFDFDLSRPYFITSVSSGKVMDARDASQEDWTPIIQTTRHDGSSQQWRFEPLHGPDEGYYHVRSVRSDKCLDVKLGEMGDGAAIILYVCADGDGQKWRLIPTDDNGFFLQAKHSGKVIDVRDLSSDDIPLIQFDRRGGKNQQWVLRENP